MEVSFKEYDPNNRNRYALFAELEIEKISPIIHSQNNKLENDKENNTPKEPPKSYWPSISL